MNRVRSGLAHTALCIQAAQLHVQMGEYIEELAVHTGLTGEPIMRHLEYMYPDMGYKEVVAPLGRLPWYRISDSSMNEHS
ncbi:hypothetical protein [Paenibacillus sp. CMAA1364]